MLLSGVLLRLPFSKSLCLALGQKSIFCTFPACALSEAWAAPLPCPARGLHPCSVSPTILQAQGVCDWRGIIRSGSSLLQAYSLHFLVSDQKVCTVYEMYLF